MSNDHKVEIQKMLCSGIVLDLVNNLPSPGKYNFLQNIRILLQGALESRSRVDSLATLNPIEVGVPHSLDTILNKANNTKLRILGINDKLYKGSGSPLILDTSGYSGEPLSTVAFRPESSIQAYLYIASSSRMRKVGVDGVSSDIGIQSPRLAATYKLTAPQIKIIDECGAATLASWIQAGSAGAPTDESRINTTITAFIKDDAATPCYASIVPVAFSSSFQAGAIVKLNGADEVIIEEIFAAALNTGVATISKITYEVGNTGLCKIVLSIATQAILPNCILLLNGTEYVRVLEVTYDNNGIPSIKTSTVGTFAATNTVSGVASFRFYATNSYVATNTIITRAIKTVIGASGLSSLTRTFNVDLTTTGTKSLTEDSLLHISILLSDPSKLTELQIQLDVDSAVNDFTKNFYSYVVSPNFFIASSQQTTPTISVIQQALQRQQLLGRLLQKFPDFPDRTVPLIDNLLDAPNGAGSPNQTELGMSQWTELYIRLGDFLKTGPDSSRTLKDVKAVRISVNANTALDLWIDSIWAGKVNQLDSSRDSNFLAYNWVWRIRDPATKAKSNWSPPLRNGIRTNRTSIELSFPNANSDYSTNYKIDIARFGGTLNDFRIVGKVKNDGSTFIDESSDRIIADNELAGRLEGDGIDAVFDFYQPFAILDIPRTSVVNITGTEVVRVSGDIFNVTWPRGVLVYINGVANKLYTRPESTTKLSLEKDVGALTNATLEIISPLLTAQPLPILFGPIGEGSAGLTIFGAGDKNAVGTLYWLDGNSPDTMSDLNFLEITSPSEPILAGIVYDGYGFIYTQNRGFYLNPTYASGSLGFVAKEIANSRGVFCRTGICVGRDFIYQISENADGIYKSQGGGNPVCISNSIGNLFYQNGVAPSSVTLIDGTVVFPPDFSLVNELRLYTIKDHVVFRFIDSSGSKSHALIYSEKIEDWISYDTYRSAVGSFYQEELDGISNTIVGIEDTLGATGSLGIFANSGTRENTQTSIVLPFAFDDGNSRQEKLFDEIMIDALPTADGIFLDLYYDNGATNDSSLPIVGVTRNQFIVQINDGLGRIKKNITTRFSWFIKSGAKLYEEQYWFVPKNISIIDRASDLNSLGDLGLKLWQGVTIDANTSNVDKTLKFLDDFGTIKAAVVIKHDGQIVKDYSFDQPFISHKIRQISDDNVAWVDYDIKYWVDAEPELGMVWEGEISTGSIPGYYQTAIPDLIQIKSIGIAYRALVTDADVKLLLYIDNIVEEINYPQAINGIYNKEWQYTTARKGKFVKYRIQATSPIQVFEKDCEVELRGWTSKDGFNNLHPFGGNSRVTGAQI